jgi:hypothetical protein
MKDVVIRGIRVPAKRARWVFLASALAIISGLAGLYVALRLRSDFTIKKHFLASELFLASRAFGLAAIVLVAPRVVLPLAFILAPFLTAMFAMEHEPWSRWWFWPATALCEIVGGYALLKVTDRWKNDRP